MGIDFLARAITRVKALDRVLRQASKQDWTYYLQKGVNTEYRAVGRDQLILVKALRLLAEVIVDISYLKIDPKLREKMIRERIDYAIDSAQVLLAEEEAEKTAHTRYKSDK